MLVEHVHAAGRLEERRVERAQALPDRVELDADENAIAAANIAFCTL
jgi:hypothetical protein